MELRTNDNQYMTVLTKAWIKLNLPECRWSRLITVVIDGFIWAIKDQLIHSERVFLGVGDS